jgi:hypothetical protein
MSKGRGRFAFAMSLSTQTNLWMNFQVSLLMENNILYINNWIVLNDSSTTTQIQNHWTSRLYPKRLKNESFTELFFSVFLLVDWEGFEWELGKLGSIMVYSQCSFWGVLVISPCTKVPEGCQILSLWWESPKASVVECHLLPSLYRSLVALHG